MHPTPAPLTTRSLVGRVLVAVALATAIVAGLAQAAPAATKVAGPTAPPPPTSGTTYAAPTIPPGEVVLGQLTSTPPQARSPRPTPTPSGPTGKQTAPGPYEVAHDGADDLKAAAGCAIQCIASGVAYARGPGARLVIETDGTPVFLRLVVNGPGYTRQVESAEGVTSFAHTFGDLEADTTYQAVVTAWDAAGNAVARAGSFTTLERHVEITFGDAEIIDAPYDSDFWRAFAWVDDLLVVDSPSPAADDDTVSLPNGTALDATFAHGDIDLAVELTQAEAWPDDPCEVIVNDDAPNAGSSECDRWESAYAEVDVDDRPSGATSWTEWTIEALLQLPSTDDLPPGYGEPLNFQVPVTLEVTFE